MNIIERAQQFVESKLGSAKRTGQDWRRCPWCEQTQTRKHGVYMRYPWTLEGRQEVRVQRHWCLLCKRSYSEKSAELVEKGRYARDVRRKAVDDWQHQGGSLRRIAELLRSEMGRQECWLIWHAPAKRPEGSEDCYLGASSVHRWLDGIGREAQKTIKGQLEGIANSGRVGVDGLWARLRGGVERVVLVVTDSLTGLVYPPVVVEGEKSASSWAKLFGRAGVAGLDLQALRGITSDGAHGLSAYLREGLNWVNQQRCILHV